MNPIDGGGVVRSLMNASRVELRMASACKAWVLGGTKRIAGRIATQIALASAKSFVAFHNRTHEMRNNEFGRMPQLSDFLRHQVGARLPLRRYNVRGSPSAPPD